MKLVTKTNRYYASFVGVLLLFGAIGFYIAINTVIRHEIEETLHDELDKLSQMVLKNPAVLTDSSTADIDISRYNGTRSDEVVSDTLVLNERENDLEPFIQLKAFRIINGESYQFVIRKSLIESEDILMTIAGVFSIIAILIFIGIFLINKFLSQKLWNPFFQNIAQLRSYDLGSKQVIGNIPSDIDEFRELNLALQKMTTKIQGDYTSLKEFTENASHEIQTPLAILKSGIDNLMQSALTAKDMDQLAKLESVINRISKTNQALLILTKIENNQFTEVSKLDLGEMIAKTLNDFKDFAEAKNLSIEFDIPKHKMIVDDSRTLYQILFTNLVSNAIKHNTIDGYIKIIFSGNEICIENSGLPLDISPDKLFERFAKGAQSTTSPGLGLSIVQKICAKLNLSVQYQSEYSVHKMILTSPTKPQKD